MRHIYQTIKTDLNLSRKTPAEASAVPINSVSVIDCFGKWLTEIDTSNIFY